MGIDIRFKSGYRSQADAKNVGYTYFFTGIIISS
jgi:hypothetical protein